MSALIITAVICIHFMDKASC